MCPSEDTVVMVKDMREMRFQGKIYELPSALRGMPGTERGLHEHNVRNGMYFMHHKLREPDLQPQPRQTTTIALKTSTPRQDSPHNKATKEGFPPWPAAQAGTSVTQYRVRVTTCTGSVSRSMARMYSVSCNWKAPEMRSAATAGSQRTTPGR